MFSTYLEVPPTTTTHKINVSQVMGVFGLSLHAAHFVAMPKQCHCCSSEIISIRILLT